ncbi:MAG TPA: F0F1 ATP synthase subunit A [Mycoplasmatales bacterium]|nr:F0F1 ATP synthase subunit A [Mycoplasmatales bacterium]
MRFEDLLRQLKDEIARRKTVRLKARLNKEFLLRVSKKPLGLGSAVAASVVAAIIYRRYFDKIEEHSIVIPPSKFHYFEDQELAKLIRVEALPPDFAATTAPTAPTLTKAKAKVISAEEIKKIKEREDRANDTWDMLWNVSGNSSPFENFELALLFPSCVFVIIFLFTSFNLVLFQIILILFNLHEFFLYTFKPNSFILRSNAVLMNFLFNLHCSQSYSKLLLKFFPITLTVFLFILFGNLTGLLPWSFSYTGHIGLTFSLGIMLFQGWLIVGLDRLGGDFWALFIPHNCPKWLFPLMLVIEILSFLIRPFSLAIRLFANILSGHILLHLIKETEEIIRDEENNGYMNMIPSSVSSLVSLSESMVIVLELGVACLQGYIFVILSSIYLQESVNERNLGVKSIKEYCALIYKFINKYILKIDLIKELWKSKDVAELEEKVKKEIEVILLRRMDKDGVIKLPSWLKRF